MSDGDQCEAEQNVLGFLAEQLGVEVSDLVAIDIKAQEIAEAEMENSEMDEEGIIQV